MDLRVTLELETAESEIRCKLTEVRIRPLLLSVISVMKSELCDFRVAK